jgi:Alpha/beta hydrolase domain
MGSRKIGPDERNGEIFSGRPNLPDLAPFLTSLLSAFPPTPVGHEVGHYQRREEQEQAEDEKQEPAVTLATSHPSRPEGQEDQDDEASDPDANPGPAGQCKQHAVTLHSRAGWCEMRVPESLAFVAYSVRHDDLGNATGGIRLPELLAPTGVHSGTNAMNPLVALSGQGTPFTAEQLGSLYSDAEAFLSKWDAAVDQIHDQGLVLGDEIDTLRARGRQSPSHPEHGDAVRDGAVPIALVAQGHLNGVPTEGAADHFAARHKWADLAAPDVQHSPVLDLQPVGARARFGELEGGRLEHDLDRPMVQRPRRRADALRQLGQFPVRAPPPGPERLLKGWKVGRVGHPRTWVYVAVAQRRSSHPNTHTLGHGEHSVGSVGVDHRRRAAKRQAPPGMSVAGRPDTDAPYILARVEQVH